MPVAAPVSAARLGVPERSVLDAHFQPTCRAGRSTNLSVDHITETDVTLPNEDWGSDRRGRFDAA